MKRANKEIEVKTKKSLFWKIYWIYTVVLAATIVALLIVLWKFLGVYENTRPTFTMDALMLELEAGNYDTFTQAFAKEENLENASVVLPALFDGVEKNAIAYGKLAGKYTEKHPVYAITINKELTATISLKQSSQVQSFGLQGWELDGMSAVANGSEKALVTIPTDAFLIVNDIAVAQNETGSYSITGLYHKPVIEVMDKEGNKITLAENEDGSYKYSYYTVFVPDGMTLKVAGKEVPETYIKGENRLAELAFMDELCESFPEYVDIMAGLAVPKQKEYFLNMACNESDIAIFDEAGIEKELSFQESQMAYYLPWESVEIDRSSCEQVAYAFTLAYTKFVSNEQGASAMAKYMPANSSYYIKMSKMVNNWYPKHSDTVYSDLNTLKYVGYGDDIAYITVNMKQDMFSNFIGARKTYDIQLPLWMMKLDGTWKVAMIDYDNTKME